jgi:hypothetical protein
MSQKAPSNRIDYGSLRLRGKRLLHAFSPTGLEACFFDAVAIRFPITFSPQKIVDGICAAFFLEV